MDVLTPDFYSYAWVPLVDARVDGRFVVLTWGDGVEYRAFDLWLRENAVGAGGVDAATREGIMDPAHHRDDAVTASATVQPDGALAVEWKPDLVPSSTTRDGSATSPRTSTSRRRSCPIPFRGHRPTTTVNRAPTRALR